ncbi:protein NTM1-like 9 [Rhodamnia argentea]|uniref:Protein NTM1-like 9 n=1 Tax=Rhodamnia argentea TaxID=178133 RepID=A0ABM3HGA1_9MYRT|nr:protein NTM1-like 9 [Rhodamnia argentea]
MGAVVIPSNLPVGYRFHPTDEEFVGHYLKNRVRGFVDCPCIIPDVDICRWDPWQLPQKFHGESVIFPYDKVREWWFFCPQTTEQVKRSTPSGYWKKTGTDRNVKARYTNRVIGTKKTLVFHEGRGKKGVKSNWVIHEYHLPDDDDKGDEKADDLTIELEPGAMLEDLVSALRQPDNEDSFPESLIQAMMTSLMDPSFQAISRDLLQLLQPALQSHPFMDIKSPPFMDSSLGRSLAECYDELQCSLCAIEEGEDVDAGPSSIRQGRQEI